MPSLLAKFLSTFGLLLAWRPKILLFLHWSSLIRQLVSSEVSWKSEGLDPGQNISKGIRINSLPIKNKYIFLSFCLELCQNKHLLDLSLSESRVLGEDPLLNAFLPFWNFGKVWSCSEIWDLLQDLLPPSFLFTKNKLLRNSPGCDFSCWIAPFLNISFISELICNLSSLFTLANWGGPYWNGVWEKGILKPCTIDKIFTSWVNFFQFSE